jgi:hypothetical protein
MWGMKKRTAKGLGENCAFDEFCYTPNLEGNEERRRTKIEPPQERLVKSSLVGVMEMVTIAYLQCFE